MLRGLPTFNVETGDHVAEFLGMLGQVLIRADAF